MQNYPFIIDLPNEISDFPPGMSYAEEPMSANQNAWHALSSLGGPSRPAQPQVLLKSSGKYNVTKQVLNTMQFCQNYIYKYV